MGLCSPRYGGMLRLIEKRHHKFFLFYGVDKRFLNEYFALSFFWLLVSDLDPLVSQLNATYFCWKCFPHKIIIQTIKGFVYLHQ